MMRCIALEVEKENHPGTEFDTDKRHEEWYNPHPSAPQMKYIGNRGQTILESEKEKESTEREKK